MWLKNLRDPNVFTLLEHCKVEGPAPYKSGKRCCQLYDPIYLKQEEISVIKLSSSDVVICTYPSMLNIQAVNLFLALSRAEKISSRNAIPIGSKMAFKEYPPRQ